MQKGDDKMNVKMGDQTINIDMGQQTVNAMQKITLNAGPMGMGCSIEITVCSIKLKSPMIMLDASGTGGVIVTKSPATAFPGGAVAVVPGPFFAVGTVVPPAP
jgi:hypothetical protein